MESAHQDANGKVGPALSNVVLAGQQLLADRVELALLDGQKALGRMATNAALLLFGGLLLLSALVVADVALIDVVARSTASRTPGLLGCAALHAALGGALLLRAMRRGP